MFTFKTDKPTGRYKSFFSDQYHIKLKGKKVGSIDSGSPYKIRLMAVKNDINEDGNPNCIWKWVTLKKESSTIEEAKVFLKENYKTITTKYNLHLLED